MVTGWAIALPTNKFVAIANPTIDILLIILAGAIAQSRPVNLEALHFRQPGTVPDAQES